jgi:hypothetical protein
MEVPWLVSCYFCQPVLVVMWWWLRLMLGICRALQKPLSGSLFSCKSVEVFANPIATLRKQYKLRQSDIIGLSDRQVRRIEQGDGSTKVDTLRLFSKAHDMELDAYLDAVVNAVNHFSLDPQ